MPILDMTRRIKKSCERRKQNLVQWRRDPFHMSTAKSNDTEISDKEKEKFLKVQRTNYISSGKEVLSITHLLLV